MLEVTKKLSLVKVKGRSKGNGKRVRRKKLSKARTPPDPDVGLF